MRVRTELLFIGILLFQSGLSVLTPKIAIVGGGIGGASAAHFLNELFRGELAIDLFEAKNIGGRLATVEVAGTEYESGGAIIHDRNLLMKSFVKLLGMKETPTCGNRQFGIWNAKNFVFKSSSSYRKTQTNLFSRYGFQLFQLKRYIDSMLYDFEKIYISHDNGTAFTSVIGLLSAMNNEFPNMLETSTGEHLTSLGYSYRIIHELVEASLVVNYGQSTDVHSFVGCVSLAGAWASSWSVKGGNKNVPNRLIYRNSRVNVVPSIVKKIVHQKNNADDPRYEIQYSNKGSSESMKSIDYDIVILATPLTNDHEMRIEFENFPEDTRFEFPGGYQTTFATFVHGDLNSQYFNLEDPIRAVLSCDPNKTIVSSVSNLNSVEGNCSRVWKIFTGDRLDQSVIDEMFKHVEHIKRIKWKAYPKYSMTEPRLDFKLHDSLYHVNAIEWAASAMEMSAIGGRNVAILAYNEYTQRDILAKANV